MALVGQHPELPQANVVHYKGGKWTMARCWVQSYDEATQRYVVTLETDAVKKVKRLSLRFDAEDPENFRRRVETCRAKKAWCETQESFIDFIEAKRDALVTPMPRPHKEHFIRLCVEKSHLEDPNAHVDTIRELVREVEQNYVQAVKFSITKEELIEGHGTHLARLDEESDFYPVLSSFLPRPVPQSGLVDHQKALQSVLEVVEEVEQRPTFASSIFSMVSMVWRRYSREVAKHYVLDTSRCGAGDFLEPRPAPGAGDPSKRVFELEEFLEHMVGHRQNCAVVLKRMWRDYIIAEVLDKTSDLHNFFVDDSQRYLKGPLHHLLRKLDLMLNSQVRWFMERSVEVWVEFVQSFQPSVMRPLPPPLLLLHLVATEQDVSLQPEPDELVEALMTLLDGTVEVTSAISCIEHELVPFCNLPHRQLFQPLEDPDARRCAYEPLARAKEVTRQVIEECLKAPSEVQAAFQEYAYLLGDSEAQDLDPLDVEQMREKITAYREAATAVEHLSTSVVDFPLFQLDCAEIIDVLATRAEELATDCLTAVAESIEERSNSILEEWRETHDYILSTPENESQLARLKDFTAAVQKQVVRPLQAKSREVHEQINLVESFSFELQAEVVEKAFESFSWPLNINMAVMESERRLEKEQQQFREQLDAEREEFWKDLKQYRIDLDWTKSLDDFENASKHSNRILKLQEDFEKARTQVQSFAEREALFGAERGDYSELEELIEEFSPFYKLWHAAIEWTHSEEEWLSSPLVRLNASEIETTVDESFKDSYKMFKSFEGQQNPQKVAEDFRKKIQAFKKNMPVVQGLCQEAIQVQHFMQLFEEMDLVEEIDVEEGLSLTTLLDNHILDHIEKVERISTEAQKQHGLKVTLAGMKKEWKGMELGTLAYKNTGTYLLKGIDDVQALLDDHIIKTQALRGSPFVKPIEKEVKDWETKLIYIQDLLEQWLACQRTWLYLEPIFSADDIIRQMPNEAKKFQSVDKLWRDTMDAILENPNVIDISDIEGLLPSFTEANKKLDAIQKCLNDYLETKRLAFPRFFFLSNDELLMILSQTKDPTAVQPHMGKCFEGINKVRFDSNDEIIEAMISVEGEVVELDKCVNVVEGDKKGNVEKWLMEVQDSMIQCLTKVTGDSVDAYAVKDRKEWVLGWPGQVVIAVDNIYWTKEVAEAITNGTLPDYLLVLADQLGGLVELVRGDLSKLARRTLTAMVTIDVHNRDVVGQLAAEKLSSPKDFGWMAQLRYYWAPAGSITMYETGKPNTVDKCQVSIINATLLYGFEYLGNSDRLVITPLTDRCYRTLMGAFHLFYGGAPEGPAGTGKTESTKDLAKAMAVQCVVFNCSDGLDYLAMAKFFKGLASSGSWCCFDEFNRIDLEVLSVVAQQVLCIQEAIRAKKKTFVFEGTELTLIPTCAVNITMNPGYAGRSELPDNLKALFRPCAMMVPDYAMIGEIVLMSVGFGDAKKLAAKAVASLRLGSEQLSSQDHYDFGMRALKSILVAAGQLRRKWGNNRSEDVLMLSALMDVNLPKFNSNDIPLFLGITGDLFPRVELPSSDYGALLDMLGESARERGLQVKDSFIHKCTQLWETIMVRHGLMVVGATMSGKTEIENVLAKALEKVADGDLYLPVEIHKINPKSIKQGQLYGDFDENTHEWTDGILALTVRYTSNADPSKRQWILLDGPVDAVWIENMNTVLDDNKKLCLNSGEIIKLSPVSTMMFEVEDLAAASPATVSRCGMVFMEQVDIGWRVLLTSWVERLPERLLDVADKMAELFDANVPCAWEMLQRKVKSPVPVNQNWVVMNLLNMYLALLKTELPLDPDSKAEESDVEGVLEAHTLVEPRSPMLFRMTAADGVEVLLVRRKPGNRWCVINTDMATGLVPIAATNMWKAVPLLTAVQKTTDEAQAAAAIQAGTLADLPLYWKSEVKTLRWSLRSPCRSAWMLALLFVLCEALSLLGVISYPGECWVALVVAFTSAKNTFVESSEAPWVDAAMAAQLQDLVDSQKVIAEELSEMRIAERSRELRRSALEASEGARASSSEEAHREVIKAMMARFVSERMRFKAQSPWQAFLEQLESYGGIAASEWTAEMTEGNRERVAADVLSEVYPEVLERVSFQRRVREGYALARACLNGRCSEGRGPVGRSSRCLVALGQLCHGSFSDEPLARRGAWCRVGPPDKVGGDLARRVLGEVGGGPPPPSMSSQGAAIQWQRPVAAAAGSQSQLSLGQEVAELQSGRAGGNVGPLDRGETFPAQWGKVALPPPSSKSVCARPASPRVARKLGEFRAEVLKNGCDEYVNDAEGGNYLGTHFRRRRKVISLANRMAQGGALLVREKVGAVGLFCVAKKAEIVDEAVEVGRLALPARQRLAQGCRLPRVICKSPAARCQGQCVDGRSIFGVGFQASEDRPTPQRIPDFWLAAEALVVAAGFHVHTSDCASEARMIGDDFSGARLAPDGGRARVWRRRASRRRWG
ncbi:unnamed protein product [Prorocentrum cordatum]|uniref:Dynein heavy chain n=1 Tax=Prorocentrum cordatum TaxID=2364126 RepID=A0ABN9Y2P4_9DINO|nr:unnamed protein product [Polarella glacialis]